MIFPVRPCRLLQHIHDHDQHEPQLLDRRPPQLFLYDLHPFAPVHKRTPYYVKLSANSFTIIFDKIIERLFDFVKGVTKIYSLLANL